MADWKQITARIRRARGSKDPAGQLTLLFEKTKDAMVAFELGRHFEIVRNPAQALEWYQNAYSRFRRGDWKTKCGEAIARLGGELPVDLAQKSRNESAAALVAAAVTVPEPALPFEQNATAFESPIAVGSENLPCCQPLNLPRIHHANSTSVAKSLPALPPISFLRTQSIREPSRAFPSNRCRILLPPASKDVSATRAFLRD
jgi:hypothetical protein